MKPATSLFVALCLPLLATALEGGRQQVLGESNDLAVPGSNPLEFCSATENYSLKIETVDLIPNPPKKYARHSAPDSVQVG